MASRTLGDFKPYRLDQLRWRVNHVKVSSSDASETLKKLIGVHHELPLAMVSVVDGPPRDFGLGSAFFIAPGVAVSALHIIEASLKSPGILLNSHMPELGGVRPWFVHHLMMLPDSDLALLSCDYLDLETESEKVFNLVVCNCMPQPVGEKVLLLGTKPENEMREYSVHFSFGTISDVVERRLAGSQLIQREYLVEATSAGGMSGGPAFNSDGACIGLISSGMNFEDGAGYTRVISLEGCISGRTHSRFLSLPVDQETPVVALPYLRIENLQASK